jgi:hypothetical protein
MRAYRAVDQATVERTFRDAEQLAQCSEAVHLCWVKQGFKAFSAYSWVQAHWGSPWCFWLRRTALRLGASAAQWLLPVGNVSATEKPQGHCG